MTTQKEVQDFIILVQEELKKQYLTPRTLADKIGTSRSAVYKWLDGSSVMSLEHFYRILKALRLKSKIYKRERKII